MADYQKMYLRLFNQVTDAIALLQQAQQETEELYIAADDTMPSLQPLPDPPEEEQT